MNAPPRYAYLEIIVVENGQVVTSERVDVAGERPIFARLDERMDALAKQYPNANVIFGDPKTIGELRDNPRLFLDEQLGIVEGEWTIHNVRIIGAGDNKEKGADG